MIVVKQSDYRNYIQRGGSSVAGMIHIRFRAFVRSALIGANMRMRHSHRNG